MPWIKRIGLGALAIGALSTAHAALTVIADHGSQPARPYYAPIAAARVDEQQAYSAHAEATSRGPITEADLLPVTSNRLSPGRVANRAFHLPPGTTPFFIIGADTLSRRWLRQRGARLRQLHAVGLVVNVHTASQLQQLRTAGHDLVMRPVAGDDLARRLHLSHYPVLVTPQGVQQ